MNKKEQKKRGISISDSKQQIPEIKNAMTKVYMFHTFRKLQDLASLLHPVYSGENSLYLDENAKQYYLVVRMSAHSPEQFNKVCNILSEYGTPAHTTYATPAYLEEHMRVLIPKDAILHLSDIHK